MQRATPELLRYLQGQFGELARKVERGRLALAERENELLKKEAERRGRGMGEVAPPSSSQVVTKNIPALSNLPFYLAPGNVGDINSMIWPFFYPTGFVEIPPGSQVTAGFSVTQEASFVALSFSKAVFVKNTVPVTTYTYINPDDPAGAGQASQLSMSIQDNTSSRLFIDKTMNLDHVGNPRFPTQLPTPMLMLPRTNISINFTNSNSTDTFVAFINFFGYRVRIQDADTIRALATTGA